MRTGFNNLRVQVYSTGTTPIYDPGDLPNAENARCTTLYPGGRYGVAELFIPRPPLQSWKIKLSQRIALFNGLKIVWEGAIVATTAVWGPARQGTRVVAIGLWGHVMMQRNWRKRWADTRVEESAWGFQTAATAADKVRLDRTDRLQFSPEGVEWQNGEYAAVRYTMPAGETVKRITYSYDFSELALGSPKKAWHFDSAGPTYTSLDNAIDGSASTSITVTITTGDYLYIDLLDETTYAFIRVDMGGTVNANASVLSAAYPADDGAGSFAWTALTISDGTASAGKTLAQDGDITFTRPGDMVETSVNGVTKAWVRLAVSANLTASIVINELRLGQTQAWKASLYNVGTAAEVSTITATGTGTTDHTLATPSQSIELRLVSLGKQTPPGNGTIYARWTDVTVYSETGSINSTEIIKDIQSALSTRISSFDSFIGSNTYSLVPFIADEFETMADIAMAAAAFGGSSQEAWAVGMLASSKAAAPDGKPVLFYEAQPALTDYEYKIVLDLDTLQGELALEYTLEETHNSIKMAYTDEEGNQQWVTPIDDSSLQDSDSITAWGQHDVVFHVPGRHASQAAAINAGVRFLNQHKDPTFRLSGGISVIGYILDKNGIEVPACEIEAGKRVRVASYLDDGTETWQIYLITGTDYNDAGEECRLDVGRPDHAGVFFAQLEREAR